MGFSDGAFRLSVRALELFGSREGRRDESGTSVSELWQVELISKSVRVIYV